MQTVILAGGLGTRLGALTRKIPKPMAPVAGMPYLEHQLRLLERQSLRDVLLLTGYLGDQIESYFGNGGRLGLRIRYSRERRPLGTGGALREARRLLDESFLLMYGDSLLPIDYSAPSAAWRTPPPSVSSWSTATRPEIRRSVPTWRSTAAASWRATTKPRPPAPGLSTWKPASPASVATCWTSCLIMPLMGTPCRSNRASSRVSSTAASSPACPPCSASTTLARPTVCGSSKTICACR